MIKLITLTNNGYKRLTHNCIESLKKIGLDNILKVYCIDNSAYEYIKEINGEDKTILMDLEDNEIESNFIKFRHSGWSRIVLKKFQIIYNELIDCKENEYVLFTDGDIVYLKNNILNYCESFIKENDNEIVFQNDFSNPNIKNRIVCSGFMLIKKTDKILEIFSSDRIKNYNCDQDYINDIKNELNYGVLDLDLFPHGFHYGNNKDRINPFMIHFNWLIGNDKEKKMREWGKWYLQ